MKCETNFFLFLWGRLEISHELLRLIVENQFFRELSFLYQRHDIAVVGNHGREVGITSKDDWCLVLLGKFQQFQVIGSCHRLVADGSHGVIVDFEQGMRLLGNLHQSLEIQFCRSISRMGDNLHEWIAHGIDDTLRVLFLGPSLPAKAMNASDSDIKYAPVILIEVNIALGIEDVELRSQHQLDSI